MNLCSHVLDHLTLQLICFIGVRVAAHQTEQFNVVIKCHIFQEISLLIIDLLLGKELLNQDKNALY